MTSCELSAAGRSEEEVCRRYSAVKRRLVANRQQRAMTDKGFKRQRLRGDGDVVSKTLKVELSRVVQKGGGYRDMSLSDRIFSRGLISQVIPCAPFTIMHKFPTLCLDRKDGASVFLQQKSCVFSYDEKGIEPSKFQCERSKSAWMRCSSPESIGWRSLSQRALSKLLPFIEKNVRQVFEWTP